MASSTRDLRPLSGTTLAVPFTMIDARLELTELFCLAMDAHDQRPLTRSAALAAHALAYEDRRRRGAGIPSIFELPRRAAAGGGSP